MRSSILSLLFSVVASAGASAQVPIEIHYTVRTDTIMKVSMRVSGAVDTFVIAAAAHPEYDDKYWRYIEGLTVSSGSVARIDSVRWRVTGAHGVVNIQYVVRIPPSTPLRASWRAHIDNTGGLVGGPHSFLYVVGAENARARVTLDMPAGWRAASSLTATSDPRTFEAPNITTLMESPILVGPLREWRFHAGGVPHRVVYWPQPNAVAFDTIAFVNTLKSLAEKTIDLFGSAPYREFTFLFRDDAWTGGLEHPASVTLGAPSVDLARDPAMHLIDTAHEFVHTWNLMSIRPAEYRGVDYRVQPPVSGLWFSEGLTLFYADLLLRRAGGAGVDGTRAEHVAMRIEDYISNPGNLRFSAEHVSRLAYNAGPGAFGDYDAGTHTQGEIIGTMLDIIVRHATNGERSMDDVMRLLYRRFPPSSGFVGTDIEQAVGEVCGCSLKEFFDAHVRGNTPIDYNRYLALLGMRARVEQVTPRTSDGQPQPDLNVGSWDTPDGRTRIRIRDPKGAWGRAGLHTGDLLVRVNGVTVNRWLEFRRTLSGVKNGDIVRVVVSRDGRDVELPVTLTGYTTPSVMLENLSTVTRKQQELRIRWIAGH